MDLPLCPECGSPAIARRYVFLEDANKLAFITRACKACDHEWLNDEDLTPETRKYVS
jgi:hypothetical protein